MDKIGLNPATLGLERPGLKPERPPSDEALRLVEPMARTAPPARDDVDDAVRDMNEAVQMIQRNLEFSVSETSGRILITVMDSETSEIVRQIPPEKLVAAAENLSALRGLLYEDEV